MSPYVNIGGGVHWKCLPAWLQAAGSVQAPWAPAWIRAQSTVKWHIAVRNG